MKHFIKYIGVLTFFILLPAIPAMAADMDHSPDSQDMKNMDEMDKGHNGQKGDMIREATVDGFHLMYHLIDMQEQIEQMKAAGHTHEMKNTHHLMVYVTDADGNAVTDAQVGYLIQTTKDKNQKTMAMAMAGGFGADVDLSVSEMYTIKTKIVAGKKTIMDKFDYMRP